MAAMSGHVGLENQRFDLHTKDRNSPMIDDLAQARKEIELLRVADPFNVVELVLELQMERIRTAEAMSARDAVLQRLTDAYESLHQKTAMIEFLRQESSDGPTSDLANTFNPFPAPEMFETARLRDEIAKLEETIKDLRDEIRFLKESAANVMKSPDPPPCYEEGASKNPIQYRPPLTQAISDPGNQLSSSSQIFSPTPAESPSIKPNNDEPVDYRVARNVASEPAATVAVRNAILSTLPLPVEVPDDTLSPLCIPAPFTLQEFIANLSGPLRTSLVHYRLFYALTTQWCPEREEHGYFYTPAYKCSTNPRVATAHRWNAVDVISRMIKPTECFFNKDGTWYYAGVYKAFRLEDLTTQEWAELPTETTQAIVKDTISGRKNTSPQNVYEISQLYAAGALKVACVGLQCVGFNNAMYKALLEQAGAFSQNKWKGSGLATAAAPTPAGLGTGSVWNSAGAGGADIVAGVGAMILGRPSTERNENIPAVGDKGKR